MCARCEELEEEVAYLRSELGLQIENDRLDRVRSALRVLGTGARKCGTGEAKILLVLHSAKGRTVTRLQILEACPPVGGGDDDRVPALVDVRVCNLRSALGRAAIENAWGKGYRLTPEGMARVAAILNPPGEDALLDHCREGNS